MSINQRNGACRLVRDQEVGGLAFSNSSFIPIYPNALPTVPKSSRASRTASLVFNELPASQGTITRLLNRCSKSRADSAVDIISHF